MRMCGVNEGYITGGASNKEKFVKWCETVPKLIGGPLYHWAVMELDTIIGVDKLPDAGEAAALYDFCNAYLLENTVTACGLLKKFNVEYASPCVSLIDDITFGEKNTNISPSLRGDDIVHPDCIFVKKLEAMTGGVINDLVSFENAVRDRIKVFEKCGCRFSDHALDNGFTFYRDDGKNEERFMRMLKEELGEEEEARLSSYMLSFLGEEYARVGFVMQLHIGAQRYTSSKLRNAVGAAGGFASIGNSVDVNSLTTFLDVLDCRYKLPKTVLFTLNPSDNALISVLSGSYSDGETQGLITQGPAWWWCDHKHGIEQMLENTSAYGVLSNFIGMTTDSRSFLSFVRHDYFRRILCDWLGDKVQKGEFWGGEEELKTLIYKICYKNAKKLLGGNE